MQIRRLAFAALLAAPLFGHHSTAMFDTEKEVTVAGVVSRFTYTSPHIYIYVNVERDGKPETLRVEGGSPPQLNRAGWSSKALTEGEKISVTIRPTKDGEGKFGLLLSVMKEDGKKLGAGGGGDGQ